VISELKHNSNLVLEIFFENDVPFCNLCPCRIGIR